MSVEPSFLFPYSFSDSLNNGFHLLSRSQFIENRVYDDDDEATPTPTTPTPPILETHANASAKLGLMQGKKFLDQTDTDFKTRREIPLLLPHLVGSVQFLVGQYIPSISISLNRKQPPFFLFSDFQ